MLLITTERGREKQRLVDCKLHKSREHSCSFINVHIVDTSLIVVEWVREESFKNAASNHKMADCSNGASIVEGYLIRHSSIRHADISKTIHMRASPAPRHPPFFGLHGCMAAGMLNEPSAGSRGHCKVTHCSWLFWPWEVSSSSASKRPRHIRCAGWWPGHPQSRLSMENKSVLLVWWTVLVKVFSYFFLDIAWWYYQYQRGKKCLN